METHLAASKLNHVCVGASEDVIPVTPHPACPQGHGIQAEPPDDLISTFAKAHKLCVQKQLFRYIFFYNGKCIMFQPSFNRHSKL